MTLGHPYLLYTRWFINVYIMIKMSLEDMIHPLGMVPHYLRENFLFRPTPSPKQLEEQNK